MSLATGAGKALTASVTPAEASNQAVTWSTSNSAVASCDSSGLVKGLSAGSATITVTTIDGGFTASCVVTVKAAPVTETRKVGLVGDSRAALAFTEPYQANTYKRNLGIASAIAAATVGVADIPTTLINGVAGDRSDQILARVPAHIQAMKAEGAVRTFLIGTTNDRTAGVSIADSKSNVLAIIKLYRDAGIYVDLISETPRGRMGTASGYELSAALAADHYAMHMWMEDYCSTLDGVTVHNWWDSWVDPASGNLYYALAAVTEDGIHPSKIGAYLGSKVSGPKLLAVLGTLPSILPTDNTLYNATSAPQGSLTANPMLTGNTGTKDSSASAITGVLPPTGWTLEAENIAGLTIVASNETVGGISYFKLKVTGKTSGTDNAVISLTQNVPMGAMVTGDKIKSVASCITEGSAISNAGISLLLLDMYQLKYDAEDSAPTLPYPTENTGRRSREAPTYVRESTVTGLQLRLESAITAGMTANATFWWSTAKVFKAAN